MSQWRRHSDRCSGNRGVRRYCHGTYRMKYSLVTRDLIADSTEALAMAHQFDGARDDPELRQECAGSFNGCGTCQYTYDLCQRRPYACRSCEGRAYEPVQYVRGQWELMRQERSLTRNCASMKIKHVLPVVPAPECILQTA